MARTNLNKARGTQLTTWFNCMKKLTILLLILLLIGCHKYNVSSSYRRDALLYGESWINAFQLMSIAGLQDPESYKSVHTEIQPILDRLKSMSGDEKKIYDEALYIDRAISYLSENTKKPIQERFTDYDLNKVFGVQNSKLPDDPSVLSNAIGNLLIRYMKVCR